MACLSNGGSHCPWTFVDTLMHTGLHWAQKGAREGDPHTHTNYTQPWQLQEDREQPEPLTFVPNSPAWKDFMSPPASASERGKSVLLTLHPSIRPLRYYPPREKATPHFHHSGLGVTFETVNHQPKRDSDFTPPGPEKWLPGQAGAEGTRSTTQG